MNKISVIAYYPGGGGNRYLRYLQKEEFEKAYTAYDQFYMHYEYRHLLDPIEFPLKSQLILTHCLNSEKIKSTVGPCDITFIITDFKKSLQREWSINGYANYKQKIVDIKSEELKKLDSAWATIVWHHDYYKNYPISTENYKVVNTLIDDNKFTQSMNIELGRYYDDTFEFCWDIYNQQGPTASIITLYTQHISEHN